MAETRATAIRGRVRDSADGVESHMAIVVASCVFYYSRCQSRRTGWRVSLLETERLVGALARWSIDGLSMVCRCCSAEITVVLLAYYWRIIGVLLLGALAGRCCCLMNFGVRSRKKLLSEKSVVWTTQKSKLQLAHCRLEHMFACLQAAEVSFPAVARCASTPYLSTASTF